MTFFLKLHHWELFLMLVLPSVNQLYSRLEQAVEKADEN